MDRVYSAASPMSNLEKLQHDFQLDDLKWIPLRHPQSFAAYSDWIDRGYGADMEYLDRHRPLKKDPRALWPEAQSILVVSKSYVPHPKPHGVFRSLRIAQYAQSSDYHEWFAADLRGVAEQLKTQTPGLQYRVGTDSWPLLERDFGAQAGLGWVGKNTCLIHPKRGSFFFLGEVLLNLPAPSTASLLDEPAPLPDFCGTCTRCLDICPTKAFESPRVLNAGRCISYWTIEAKGVPPEDLRPQMKDWFFGCDLCQSVCPWNQKPFKSHPSALETSNFLSTTEGLVNDLRDLLSLDDASLKTRLAGSPLSRSKPFGLRRNAMIVAANKRLTELAPMIERWKADERLGELAHWALQEIKRPVS